MVKVRWWKTFVNNIFFEKLFKQYLQSKLITVSCHTKGNEGLWCYQTSKAYFLSLRSKLEDKKVLNNNFSQDIAEATFCRRTDNSLTSYKDQWHQNYQKLGIINVLTIYLLFLCHYIWTFVCSYFEVLFWKVLKFRKNKKICS